MDPSKLPSMSRTPRPAEPAVDPAPPNTAPVYGRAAPANPQAGPEVVISLAVGLVLMLIGWNFARWAATTLTGGTFHTYVNWTSGPKLGTEVAYFELTGYTAWSDAAVFLFGLALVIEGLALFAAGRWERGGPALVGLAIIITAVAVVLNAVAIVLLFSFGSQPIISILAVAFGFYILYYRWGLWRSLRPRKVGA